MYAKGEKLKSSIDKKNAEIRKLTEEIPTLKSDISQLRFLFAAHSAKPDVMTQTKIAAAREIAEKHGVNSADDIQKLDHRLNALPDIINSARNEIADEQLKLKRVSDLIAAYEKIVEGNYIDNLIRAQKEREQTRTIDSSNLKKS